MTPGVTLKTDRLLLRPWRNSDLAPFAVLNADPIVAATLGNVLSRAESDALAARLQGAIELHGWGYWVAEHTASGEFAGFVGLAEYSLLTRPDEPPAAKPSVEIGWRLARGFWGQGLATEAARACFSFGFQDLRLPEIVAITAAINRRSRAVMERLGMEHEPICDFQHPRLAVDDPLRPHVFYRLAATTVG